MSLDKEFLDAINEQDILMVRIMIKDSMVYDPTFRTLNEMLTVAEENLADLYDVHDGERFIADKSQWTKSYMDDQMVKLLDNFSKERIQLLKNICATRYSHKANEIKKERQAEQQKKNAATHNKQVGMGVTAGGVALVAAGAVVSKPILIGVGIVAAVAGGILIATDN
jgi:hypothetical protein